MEAGNNLEQAVALVAAANRVVQDPNSVGSALRTISLRLRGTSVEVLEEMGEETEGVVESTSKLQEKIKALSGVDILTDTGDYKDTYTILKEIGQVWENMSDIDQAALLELIAGKNRANTLSAILSNMTDLEGAYNDALNAEGSALKENEAYLDSIQGRIDLFNNSVQTMWMNFIDSEVVKFIVDLGTGLIKLVDTIGLLPTAAGLFAGYKTAAKELKNVFGETNVSTKELKKNLNDYIMKQTGVVAADNAAAASAENVAHARENEVAATQSVSNANTTEVGTSNAAATADAAETTASIAAAEADQLEGQMSLFASNADKTEAEASKTAAMADEVWEQMSFFDDDNIGSKVGGVVDNLADGGQKIAGSWGKAGAVIGVAGKALLSSVGIMLAVQAATWALGKAWEWLDKEVIHRAENIKKEVEELKDTFEETQKTLDDNLKTLTTSSDTKLYETLEDEFKRLTLGVDQYGNNISLTSDEYERYKEICEDIVGINPKIAAGYDSAAEAIGNNASVLSELIELEKIRKRENIQEYLSYDNLGLYAEAAHNNLKEAADAISGVEEDVYYALEGGNGIGLSNILYEAYDWNNVGTKSYGDKNNYSDDLAKRVLSTLKMTDEEIDAALSKFYNEHGHFQYGDFIDAYGEYIYENADYLPKAVQDWANKYADTKRQLEDAQENYIVAQDGLVDILLQVPFGEESYDELNDTSKNFITEWIKNSEAFKIDPGAKPEEIQKQLEDSVEIVRTMIQDLIDPNFMIEYDGKKITGQEIISQIYDFDTSNVNWEEYQDKMRDLVTSLWVAIGGIDNPYGIKNYIELADIFGVNFADDNAELEKDKKLIAERLGKDIEEIQTYVDGMTAEEVQAFYKIDWNEVPVDKLKTWGDVMTYVRQSLNSTGDAIQTYSNIVSSIESYDDVLKQTEEIVMDNIEVSKEYKDSLNELGISEEELAQCFDEDNKLIVKNAALLRKLILQKKQEKIATVQQAKSYGQLQYKTTVKQIQELVGEMADQVKATGYVSSATLNNISILRDQLDIIKQTVQQYAILELSLSDAAGAYDKFEAAKERDAQLTYGDSMVEMLGVINEGFKTGQVGSEAFQFAVEALVPPEVYEGIDNVQERMRAIHDYIDKDSVFADYFTIDEGQISITMDNIKAFLQDGLDDGLGENFGVFTGTIEDFDIAPHIESIEDLAEAYGITEAAALAMLTEFEKYDASWGDIIYRLTTTELDRNIDDATIALEDAINAQEEYIKSGKPIYDENGDVTEGYKSVTQAVTDAEAALDSATQAAIDNAQANTQVEAIIKAMTGECELSQEALNGIARSLGIIGENDTLTFNTETGALELTEDQLKILNERLTGLEKPTILDIQLAYDQIDYQIQELQNYLDGESYDAQVLTDLELTDASDAEVQARLDELTADREAIQLIYNITTTSTAQDQNTMDQLATWETNGVNIVIKGDTTSIDASIAEINATEMDEKPVTITTNAEKANEEIDTVTNNNPPDKTVNIAMQGVSTALSEVNSIGDALDSLSGTRYITLAVQYDDNGEVAENANGNFHISGGAFASGTVGAPKTETSLVGELGTELIVDPSSGRWHTVGEKGAEFTQVKRGQIIFNHEQTKQLLEHGYVTSRGRLQGSGSAFASGTAYGFGIYDAYVGDSDAFKNGSDEWVDPYTESYTNSADALSEALDDAADSVGEFEEVIDWIEIRMEEFDERIGKLSAELENLTTYAAKNAQLDKIIAENQKKYSDSLAGAKYYEEYAEKYLEGMNSTLIEAAKNGSIAITEFTKEQDEATVNAIQNYRDYAQKAADLYQQAEEILTEIRDSVIQKIDNIQSYGDAKVSIENLQTEKLQNMVDYWETKGEIPASAYYGVNGGNAATSTGMFENSYKKMDYWTPLLKDMQKEFDKAVKEGKIEVGTIEWYEQLEKLYQVQAEIHEATIEIEEFQNAINDLYWENFDQLISRLDYLKEETQSLIDLMDSDDMVTTPDDGRRYEGGTKEYWIADDVKWTNEGIASLGLYAQQMEIAEYRSRQYAEAIDKLEKDYKDGLYSENEYFEKLEELTSAQYDSIESYYDAQDAIKDLNETRIDSIKEGIEKEIEAYEELIEKKKEELDAEKDLYDFQKSTMEQQKNIAEIERKLAALANDNSLSAAAKRKQLEAELAEAQYELQDSYYNRSVEDKQTALDKELEDFQAAKDAEITKWEEYLTNIELVIADSLALVQANATGIFDTLSAKATEYDLTLSDSIMTPWQDGALAVSDYQDTFDTAMSSTMDQLEALKNKWQEVIDKMAEVGNADVSAINKENANYASATKKEPVNTTNKPSTSTDNQTQNQTSQKEITIGGKINAGNAKIYSSAGAKNGAGQYFAYDPIYTVVDEKDGYVLARWHKHTRGAAGWFKKSDVKAYAKGTTGVAEDQWALLHELGDELVFSAGPNGKLQYITRGTAVVPHDISENLMKLGQLDPSDVLSRSAPQIGVSPSVVNNTMEINMNIAEVVHIDTVSNDTIPDLTKAVRKEMDSYMVKVNNAIKAKVR